MLRVHNGREPVEVGEWMSLSRLLFRLVWGYEAVKMFQLALVALAVSEHSQR